jgi:hypothetical protein
VIPINPLKCRDVDHLSIVKDLVPGFRGDFPQAMEVKVYQEKHTLTGRTGVEETVDVVFLPAIETTVDDVAGDLRDQVGLDMFGKVFDLHGYRRLLRGRIVKSEARNPKFETNPKSKSPSVQNNQNQQ